MMRFRIRDLMWITLVVAILITEEARLHRLQVTVQKQQAAVQELVNAKKEIDLLKVTLLRVEKQMLAARLNSR